MSLGAAILCYKGVRGSDNFDAIFGGIVAAKCAKSTKRITLPLNFYYPKIVRKLRVFHGH